MAVVLSHMGRPGDSQDDWVSFAGELAKNGYQALTYERGAFGDVWQDVLGAADYLRDNGAETVIAAGASLGAMASLYAAERPRSGLNGVIWLAGVLQNRGYHFQATDVSKIACPILFISGDEDTYGAAGAARQLHDWTTVPSDLLILRSTQHGTDILAEGGSNATRLVNAMLSFIRQVVSESMRTC
jgi:dienelactone hydrolase